MQDMKLNEESILHFAVKVSNALSVCDHWVLVIQKMKFVKQS